MRGVIDCVFAALIRPLHKINQFLGHGRALEAFLAANTLTWAAQLCASARAVENSIALRDFYWAIPHGTLAIPVFLVGCLMTIGLSLNYSGYECSRYFRMSGAFLGMALWSFMISQMAQEAAGFGGATPWYAWSILACMRLFYLGVLNLPRPGAPGQWLWTASDKP